MPQGNELESEVIRELLFEWLRQPGRDSSQLVSCQNGLAELAAQRFVQAATGQQGHRFGSPQLTPTEADRLIAVLWDLIFQRVLVPGGSGHDGWPFFSVTEYGATVVNETRPLPYDPDGYLRSVRHDSPNVSHTVERYLSEALDTFRSANYLASAVMLGAASERLFDELSDAIPLTHSDPAKVKKFSANMQNGNMRGRIASVVGWCKDHRAILPGTWNGPDQVDDIERVADLIRRRRNDAGHPVDPPAAPTRQQMYAGLMVFPEYCKHICELIDWAKGHQVTI